MNDLDANGDREDGRLGACSSSRLVHQRAARSHQFVRGPLPMGWFEQAATTPGKGLAVALLIWFLKGMRGSGPFPMSNRLLARFGVGRKAGAAALRRLENLGLVRVDRGPGRLARVTVLMPVAQ